MIKILVFGAGRSSYFTIQYLLENSKLKGWEVMIADASEENIKQCIVGFEDAKYVVADIHDEAQRHEIVGSQNIVISLLPARFHYLVAMDCLQFGAHLITPSYISPEIMAMDEEAKAKGLLFLNELGLDPGIDHMSAMEIINRLKESGAEITSFGSHCGGLPSKKSDNNPWHYKFSWAPYNVIRAGADGGLKVTDGKKKYVPYHRLFSETETIKTSTGESFEMYFNRNPLPYIKTYELDKIKNFSRGTLRYPGFCNLWNILVNAGITNDKIILENLSEMSWKDLFLMCMKDDDWSAILTKENASTIEWAGLLSDEKIKLEIGTCAEALQLLLENKWKMAADDKDRIVMIHEIEYTLGGQQYHLQATLDLDGEDNHKTAMAKTVGLPLALAAELISENKISITGVHLPIKKEIYQPLLKRLAEFGIEFKENVTSV
ncbi:MAG: saccharopine dehydrogenase NADP-binding domain-containing protein [Bacteroidetes bacterium]|nr:saccharopine dehydrogenase NADP-binding domain-containing protein [Bacteroidota bacterium]